MMKIENKGSIVHLLDLQAKMNISFLIVVSNLCISNTAKKSEEKIIFPEGPLDFFFFVLG